MTEMVLVRLREARRRAMQLVTQNSTYGRIEELLLAEGFDAPTTQITMHHLWEDAIATLERNERLYRSTGLVMIALAIVMFVATGVGGMITGKKMLIPWGLFGFGVLSFVRALWIGRNIAGCRGHRWLAPAPSAAAGKSIDPHAVSADALRSDEERLTEAARRPALFKRARRIGIYGRIGGALLAGYFIYGDLGESQEWIREYTIPMLTFVFLAAMLAGHVAESVFCYVEGLGRSPTFIERYFSDLVRKPKVATPRGPLAAAVPRLEMLRGALRLRVETAPLMDGPSVFTSAGGRAATMASSLPVGVILLTRTGICFLPDASPDSAQALHEVGDAAWHIAKELVKGLALLDALGIGDRPESEPSLPQWAVNSFAHPEHYAIPWPELVEVEYDPDAMLTTITREADDGTRSRFVFAGPGEWPTALMQARLMREVIEVGRANVMKPKAEELMPGLAEQFRSIYGDRLDEHRDEILRELNERVNRWMSDAEIDLASIYHGAMAPVLPYYAKIPAIVRNQPWLFPEQAEAEPAS